MPQPREQQANARNQCNAYVSTVAVHTYFLSLMDAIHDGLELCSRSGSMSWASFSSDLAISGHHRLAARAQQVQNQHDQHVWLTPMAASSKNLAVLGHYTSTARAKLACRKARRLAAFAKKLAILGHYNEWLWVR